MSGTDLAPYDDWLLGGFLGLAAILLLLLLATHFVEAWSHRRKYGIGAMLLAMAVTCLALFALQAALLMQHRGEPPQRFGPTIPPVPIPAK